MLHILATYKEIVVELDESDKKEKYMALTVEEFNLRLKLKRNFGK